jgi:outer membrane protein TolC
MVEKLHHPFFAISICLMQSCTTPLGDMGKLDRNTGTQTSERVIDAIQKRDTPSIAMTLPQTTLSRVEISLRNRVEELEKISPANRVDGWQANVGTDLYLRDTITHEITIKEAVQYAVENNLELQISSLEPPSKKQSVVSANAAFDLVLGASVAATRSRIPQQQFNPDGGGALNAAESSIDIFVAEASLTKQLESGGTLSLSTDLTKTTNDASGFNYTPNPAWQSIGVIELNQPLLRGFGKSTTLSKIKLAEIVHGQALEEARSVLNKVVTETEHAYLQLALEWKVLQTKQWLLKQGESVVEILEIRMEYDTSEADYAQAVATVEQRRAEVIGQQALVQTASDVLKQLMNTDGFVLDSEAVLQPAGKLEAQPVLISLRESIATALENRPDLRQLAMSIDSQSINVRVAKNATLPRLDLQAQLSLYGLGDSTEEGYQDVSDAEYLNYIIGLTFQVPLGNRAATAEHEIARIEKTKAIASYKQGVQKALLGVKNSLRDIVTNSELLQANKSFRIAQAENMRALTVEEETMAGLTPTFLNLKLQTQHGLASARISEFTSIVNYNKAIASLYESMGTTLEMHHMTIEKHNESSSP